jgi:hypothetical protein
MHHVNTIHLIYIHASNRYSSVLLQNNFPLLAIQISMVIEEILIKKSIILHAIGYFIYILVVLWQFIAT